MADQKFICPHCKKEIPLTEALSHQIGEKIRIELETANQKKELDFIQKQQELSIKTKELEASKQAIQTEMEQKLQTEKERIEKEAVQKAEEKISLELKDFQNQLTEKDKKLEEAQTKELELRKQQRDLEEAQKNLDRELTQRLDKERTRIEEEVRQKAQKDVSIELRDLKDQLTEKEQKLEEAQKQELELRKQRREIEETKKNLELNVERRLDEERNKVEEAALKRAAEDHRLKDLEKDKQLNDMRQQIEDLKRKADQGSQQTQGEVLELDVEKLLRDTFTTDKIEPVEKGQRGADIVHNVYNDVGQFCGTILWETKQTKTWSHSWIEKLKGDQREAKAELAILLTTAMPKEIKDFGLVEGIWVTGCSCVIGLAMALRMNLIQLARVQQAEVGKHDKMNLIYSYLCGQEFQQRVGGIVEAFQSMQESLNKEKVAMTKIWSQREKQITQVINNTVGMYGDIQGIIGASLPQIEAIELKALPAGGDGA
jgi:hypothetical protein